MSRTIHLEPDMPDVQQKLNDAPEGADIVFHGTFEGLTIQPKSNQHFLMGTLKDYRLILSSGLSGVRFHSVRFIQHTDHQPLGFNMPMDADVSFIHCIFEVKYGLNNPAISPG